MKKAQILKHVSKLKKLVSKDNYLSKSIAVMEIQLDRMRIQLHYPNPVYDGLPVTHDRVDLLYSEIEFLKEFRKGFLTPYGVDSSLPVVPDNNALLVSPETDDSLPF